MSQTVRKDIAVCLIRMRLKAVTKDEKEIARFIAGTIPLPASWYPQGHARNGLSSVGLSRSRSHYPQESIYLRRSGLLCTQPQ
jgi:hypothetical protein